MGPTASPDTSITDDQSTLRNIPEERRSHTKLLTYLDKYRSFKTDIQNSVCINTKSNSRKVHQYEKIRRLESQTSVIYFRPADESI
jgi:hypothetical protein